MPTLPTVPFGTHRISRLILGDNPIYGYSHFNRLLSQHQREFHTPEQVMITLRRAQAAGINTWQNTLTSRSLSDLQRYRKESGSIQWLCLSTGEWLDRPELIVEAARHRPIGMAPHGGSIGDRLFREGRLDTLRDLLKRIRDTGVRVGLSAHNPELIVRCEEAGWDVDYYMCALYYLRGAAERFQQQFGYPPLGEVYLREDRDRMCEVIRSTKKTCIAYKVLAAGRAVASAQQVKDEITFALQHIKTTDALLIGMYQMSHDQIGENAATVAEY